ncbi:MAG: AAA family ATPase, partial [Candidatus Pacearchaeota archaeon]|nr:AAA family ATPase [Candidatus Pacearchaeota archaeon]
MAYIKRLVMYGFKSFPRKTEIPFTSGINVILGPNGSGKSSSYDTLVTLSTGIRDLKEGDLVASPRKIVINSKKTFDKDIARLLGYLIGDGYIAKDRIEFVNKDPEIIEDFKNIIDKNFNVKIVERHEKNITRLYVREKS